WLVTGCQDGVARLWETATGREIRSFIGHKDSVNAVALSGDGKWLATGSGRFLIIEKGTLHRLDQSAALWEVATGKPVRVFQGHQDFVTSVALSAEGNWLVTGSYDQTARLWD